MSQIRSAPVAARQTAVPSPTASSAEGRTDGGQVGLGRVLADRNADTVMVQSPEVYAGRVCRRHHGVAAVWHSRYHRVEEFRVLDLGARGAQITGKLGGTLVQ